MSRLEILKDRAAMLKKVRDFFFSKNIVEVDCPLLTRYASVDAHIDLIPAFFQGKEKRYLHSSPEYGMKRLLSEGIGNCYQLAHVFRDGEYGHKHNPEFMMAEWYRTDLSFEDFINETVNFIQLFLGDLPKEQISYQQLFINYVKIDPFTASQQDLQAKIRELKIPSYPSLEEEGKDAHLNLILGAFIEPHLGQNSLTVLTSYPPSQAALAKTCFENGHEVACRFEVYHRGYELANGYFELIDPVEQRRRLQAANQERIALGKEEYPIDEDFLAALEKGVPRSCGVAVGFDRLMMLRHRTKTIQEVLPFGWANA